MSRLPRRRSPRLAVTSRPAWRDAAAYGAVAAMLATTPFLSAPRPLQSPPGGTGNRGPAPAASLHEIILPDLAVIAPKGLSPGRVARLRSLSDVRAVLAVDGASLRVRGRRVNVIGVNAQRFRSWTPLASASRQRLWTALAHGEFVASAAARRLLRLRAGHGYRLHGAATVTVRDGGAADLGIAGLGLVVSDRASTRLGLIHDVAAFISAPGARMTVLRREIRAVVGRGTKLVSLRQRQLRDPVAGGPPMVSPSVAPFPAGPPLTTTRPTSYLELFRQSAAVYCPGLSWTVLAAIGQIESGDGANNGPSPAGALGPMQFLPSTWRVWGITAFGETGPPNIMDPYDAVPSAARYLCAAGAATSGGLPRAIYAYNHATWYVRDVLALARQYARAYG